MALLSQNPTFPAGLCCAYASSALSLSFVNQPLTALSTPLLHSLGNGLRILFLPSASPIAYAGIAINAGTRDESPAQPGMAHFIEHLLFKGTQKRRAWHILNRMEAVGGELNAYTNKEETMVHTAFPAAHLERAVELLADLVLHSTFPTQEIEKEIEVIIDEIQSYEDSPSELIFDDFEELLFPNHPLGHNILGKADVLKTFTSADAHAFVRRLYRAPSMVFFLSGNYNFKQVVRLVERYLSEAPTTASPAVRIRPDNYVPFRQTMERGTHQTHLILGNRGYDSDDERRTALYLLNNLLGGPGMNSRLNVALREKRGLVYNVESSLFSYTDTGAWSIYFGTDRHDVDKCLRLTHAELHALCTHRLSPTRLHAAKKQLIGQMAVAADNRESYLLGLAKTLLHYNRCESPEDVFARIEAIDASLLLDVANDIFDENRLSLLTYR